MLLYLSDREEDFYSALYTQSQAQFNTYLASGTVLNNYAHIFDILIRLRQAVDHPYLVIYSDTQVAAKSDSANFLSVGAAGTGEQRYSAHVTAVSDCDHQL
jgi:DNA repair protein RAD16